LAPGSADLIYAVEQTDPAVAGPNTSPTGPLGMSNVDASPGYRVGFSIAASPCSSLVTSYSFWSGDSDDTITRTGVNVLNSQIIHPSTLTVGSPSVTSTARQEMSFQLVDIAYRHLWKATDATALNWQLGVRYGNMEQTLLARQTVGVATGLTTVATDVDFDGFGLTGGADYERFSCGSGMLIYG